MSNFFGGVAKATVPDNLKTAVLQACRYEPLLHASYQEMAAHYGTVILPARPRRPRDKAKAETAVLIAERQLLAALRDQKFFHVEALNLALRARLDQVNSQPFQKLEGSRESWFEPSCCPCQLSPMKSPSGRRPESTSIITWSLISTTTALLIRSFMPNWMCA